MGAEDGQMRMQEVGKADGTEGACLGGAHMVDPFPHLLWLTKVAKETTLSRNLRVLHACQVVLHASLRLQVGEVEGIGIEE